MHIYVSKQNMRGLISMRAILFCSALIFLLLFSSYSSAATAATVSTEALVVPLDEPKLDDSLMSTDQSSYEVEWGVAMDQSEMGRRILAGAPNYIVNNALNSDRAAYGTPQQGNSYRRGCSSSDYYCRSGQYTG